MKREFPSDFDPEIETSTEPWEEFAKRHIKEHREFCLKQEEERNTMRQFDTGATRDTDLNKLDYEGFLSPLVIKRYAEYLNKHRTQADGNIRDSDNWQQGIPLKVYMKSLWRHFMDMWSWHRRTGLYILGDGNEDREEAICAVIFNASGYLHELLKMKTEPQKPRPKTSLDCSKTMREDGRDENGNWPDYS